MQRVAIIGISGAGKSTLARQVGDALDLPVFHLDKLFWKPGWVQSDRDEWAALQRSLVQGERWIIDGDYSSTIEIRLDAADTIVYLDLPRRLALWRAVRLFHHEDGGML